PHPIVANWNAASGACRLVCRRGGVPADFLISELAAKQRAGSRGVAVTAIDRVERASGVDEATGRNRNERRHGSGRAGALPLSDFLAEAAVGARRARRYVDELLRSPIRKHRETRRRELRGGRS